MSILSLNHVGSLADGKPVPHETLLDRLFRALYRARMAQAERVIDHYCPMVRQAGIPAPGDPPSRRLH
ncbi:hypothetical protein CCR97_29830 [Rhodoplanes elegans]|uniref:Uncharacterized protein n=1 Tax=Rhodoplanes elegans TaxID=29408 RepID=A0A327KRF0_9BRAD|nr:hypothetical protein [Rhodoplanes elegans]MBK5962359.1 hypothetical protein [Rhodoplanes elegans]RAI40847.1 hypothetical protein CH338_05015 [Rhodoplanes elegans]